MSGRRVVKGQVGRSQSRSTATFTRAELCVPAIPPLKKTSVFQRIIEAIAGELEFEFVAVDGTIVSGHQNASDAKGVIEIWRLGVPNA